MNLTTKLILGITFGILLIISLVGGSVYFISRVTLIKQIQQNHHLLAQEIMEHIDITLFNVYQNIQLLAVDDTIENLMEKEFNKETVEPSLIERIYTNLQQKLILTGPWELIDLINKNGIHVVSSDISEVGVPLQNHAMDVIAYQNSLQGKVYSSDLVLDDSTGFPTIVFSTPVYNQNTVPHTIIGVIIAYYSWKVIQQIINKSIPETTVYLFNQQGQLLSSSNPILQNKTLSQNPIFTNLLNKIRTLPNGNEISNSLLEEKGQSLFSFVHQEGWLGYYGNQWLLVLETPLDQALAPVNQYTQFLILTVLILTILMIILAALFGHWFTRPILHLTKTTQAIWQGDKKQRATILAQDEIGKLAKNFNQMLDFLENTSVSNLKYQMLYIDLKNSEDRHTALLSAIPDHMYRISKDGNILDFKGYDEQNLIPSEKIIGNLFSNIPFPPLVKEKIWNCHLLALERGDLQTLEYELSIKGELQYFEARIVKSGGQEAVHIIRNITEKVKSELELKQLQAQLLQASKLSSIGELASGIAHEINQPLMYIRGNAQIELAEGPDKFNPQSVYKTLNIIVEGTTRMMTIINHLRNFSRQDVSQMEEVDLNQIIDNALIIQQQQFLLNNHRLKTEGYF